MEKRKGDQEKCSLSSDSWTLVNWRSRSPLTSKQVIQKDPKQVGTQSYGSDIKGQDLVATKKSKKGWA